MQKVFLHKLWLLSWLLTSLYCIFCRWESLDENLNCLCNYMQINVHQPVLHILSEGNDLEHEFTLLSCICRYHIVQSTPVYLRHDELKVNKKFTWLSCFMHVPGRQPFTRWSTISYINVVLSGGTLACSVQPSFTDLFNNQHGVSYIRVSSQTRIHDSFT